MPAESPTKPATPIELVALLIRALALEAGQLIITVQHPSKVALVDVHRRFKPHELNRIA
jgi:hypothetical protein